MAAQSIKKACSNANIELSDIDLLINASTSFDEAIPDTSTKIHKLLGLKNVHCFSIHSSCLSSLTAIDIANNLIESNINNYNIIVIVASEKSSLSINPNDPKTYCILGDMAAAVILKRDTTNSSKILNSKFVTFSEYSDCIKCNLGNIRHPSMKDFNSDDFYFKMDSFNLMNNIPEIFYNFASTLIFNDYKYVVVHQPSKFAINHVKDMIDKNKIIETFQDIGNCVSASLLYNLHYLLENKKINRGDKILLFGMGAGINIGAITLIY